ncbi:MAG: ATP-binding protein [Bacteroidota bacterium]
MPRKCKELNINSDTVNLVEVEKYIEDVFDFFGISSDEFFRSLLSVKEAVTNSIIHGNKSDRSKSVCIKAYKCNKYLYFKVIDEGDGFDYTSVKDPSLPENVLDEGGRGLFIMRKVCDSLTFREKGNVVEFRINLDGKG